MRDHALDDVLHHLLVGDVPDDGHRGVTDLGGGRLDRVPVDVDEHHPVS